MGSTEVTGLIGAASLVGLVAMYRASALHLLAAVALVAAAVAVASSAGSVSFAAQKLSQITVATIDFVALNHFPVGLGASAGLALAVARYSPPPWRVTVLLVAAGTLSQMLAQGLVPTPVVLFSFSASAVLAFAMMSACLDECAQRRVSTSFLAALLSMACLAVLASAASAIA
jgi:hypothetical protein